MIYDVDSKLKSYYVTCANWECFIKANDETDAASRAVEKANDKFKKELNLAPSITVMDISSIFKKMDVVDDVHFVYTPDALANVGMYDLSEKYNKIINLMKKEK